MPPSNEHIKNLFILGAGTSYAATRQQSAETLEGSIPLTQTPLDTQFTQAIIELGKQANNAPDWIKNSAKEFSRLTQPLYLSNIGLERVLLLQKGNVLMGQEIRTLRGRPMTPQRFRSFVESTIYMMVYRLYKATQGNRRAYINFIQNHLKQNYSDNRIITFNYDTVLDDILLATPYKVSRQELYADTLRDERKGASGSKSGEVGDPLLLKLHGSVNWSCSREMFKNLILPPSDPAKTRPPPPRVQHRSLIEKQLKGMIKPNKLPVRYFPASCHLSQINQLPILPSFQVYGDKQNVI